MKGIQIREHGGVDRLEMVDLPEPQWSAGQAVVEVRAIALNHLDLWVRRGVPGHRFPLPIIPGSEASGVLLAGGEENGWKPGDEVIVAPSLSCGVCTACLSGNDSLCLDFGIYGESFDGMSRERVAIPVRNLIRKPARLSFEEAAAVPLDFLTAWHMLVGRAHVRPGETVLVQAGGSGVGSAAAQIAKLWGATVYTTVGSPGKEERARAFGPDAIINYRETDFVEEIRKLTRKRGVDVVFEHVGGETFEKSIRALARGGRLVTCGATTGADVSINLRLIFFKLISILGSTMGSLAELHEVIGHVDEGRLSPVIDRVLPFEEVGKGHEILENREAFGKVVLRVN